MSAQDHGGEDEPTRSWDDSTRPAGESGDRRQPTRRYAYQQQDLPQPPQQSGWSQAPGSQGHDQDTGRQATIGAEKRREQRRRDVLAGVIGVLLGFIVTVLVIALTTGGDTVDTDPAAQSRIATLEARVSDLQAQLAQAEAELEETEAQLADARAAADGGGDDAQLQQQREALEDRAAALDERQAELDQREQALDEREAALDERGDGQPADGGEGTIPEVDTEGIVEAVLQRLRELFGTR